MKLMTDIQLELYNKRFGFHHNYFCLIFTFISKYCINYLKRKKIPILKYVLSSGNMNSLYVVLK